MFSAFQLLYISDRAELFISLADHNAVSQSLVKTVHSDIHVSEFTLCTPNV
jgi:hypothetical protein